MTNAPARSPVAPSTSFLQQPLTVRVSDMWAPDDYESGELRMAIASGQIRRLARQAHRFQMDGNGYGDRMLLGPGHSLTVANGRFNASARQVYITDLPLIMLRASLACDTAYTAPGSEPMIFRRPEVTLAYVPAGMSLVVDIASGSSQQGLLSFQHAGDFAARFGLQPADLPPSLRAAMDSSQTCGRVASFPVDGRLASLISQTIDSKLEGELRVLECTGRVSELVAYTLNAMQTEPALRGLGVARRRDLDLGYAARERLAREFRNPPRFSDLAHELGSNQTKLKQVFREMFGQTMADFCLERRMREAQQLLLEGDLSVAQVANRVGYQHQSSFTAAFQAHVSMAPREYRKHRGAFNLPLGYEPKAVPS